MKRRRKEHGGRQDQQVEGEEERKKGLKSLPTFASADDLRRDAGPGRRPG